MRTHFEKWGRLLHVHQKLKSQRGKGLFDQVHPGLMAQVQQAFNLRGMASHQPGKVALGHPGLQKGIVEQYLGRGQGREGNRVAPLGRRRHGDWPLVVHVGHEYDLKGINGMEQGLLLGLPVGDTLGNVREGDQNGIVVVRSKINGIDQHRKPPLIQSQVFHDFVHQPRAELFIRAMHGQVRESNSQSHRQVARPALFGLEGAALLL